MALDALSWGNSQSFLVKRVEPLNTGKSTGKTSGKPGNFNGINILKFVAGAKLVTQVCYVQKFAAAAWKDTPGYRGLTRQP
jgi:hypothetical protein